MTQESFVPILTSREQACLQLMAEGYNNARIAEHMGLSESSIRRMIVDIFGTLSVKNRVSAVTEGFRYELIK